MNIPTYRYHIALIICILLFPFTAKPVNAVCDSLLHTAIEASFEQEYFRSMELLTQAKEIAVNSKDYETLFWILNNIGINHAEMTDYNSALENFSEAYKVASEHLDHSYERSISNNIAGVYMLDNNFDKALKQYQELYEVNKNSNDSLFVGGCAMNIANASLSLNNLDQASHYINIARTMLSQYPKEMLELKLLYANLLRRKEIYREAYDIAQKSIEEARADSLQAIETYAILLTTQIMYDMKELPETIRYANLALNRNISIDERKSLYEMLSEAYYLTNNFEKGFAYKDSVLQITDSIWNKHKEYLFENSNIKIELLKRENEFKEYRLRSRNISMMMGLGILAAFILAWALINQVVKNRQEKQISQLQIDQEKQQQQLLQIQLEEERTKALLGEKRHQEEVERRDKELMSKALFIANRNDIIANIIEALSNTKAVKESNDSELKKTIACLQRSIEENEAWGDFATHFERRNDTFITALKEKHPELNNNEIRFLSLIYINLNTKEIASLLNITPEYCKKKRQQLVKKMGFENSRALFSYLNTLA